MCTSVHISVSVTKHVDWSEAISGNRLDGIVHGWHVEGLRTRPVRVIIISQSLGVPSCSFGSIRHAHLVGCIRMSYPPARIVSEIRLSYPPAHRVSRPRVPTSWAASASSRFAQGSPFAHSDQRLCRASGMTDCASKGLHVIRCSCQLLIGAYVPHPPRRLHDRYDRCRRNAEHCNIQSIRIYELVD